MTGNLVWDILLGLCIYFPSYAVGIVAHEGGHLLAAWLLDLGPRVVDVGNGSILFHRWVGRVRVVVRAMPFGGVVLTLPINRRPFANAAFYAAGPSVNAVLLGLCVAWGEAVPTMPDPAILSGTAQVLLLVKVLWPRTAKLNGRLMATDGLQLLRIVARRDPADRMGATHAALVRPHLAPGAPLPAASRHMPEIVFQVTRPDRHHETWAVRDAQDAMRDLLAEPDLPAEERTLVLTFLVDTALCLEPVGTMADELDAWSREALDRSHHAHARVMRGGALVALGRDEEAFGILRPLLPAGLAEQDRLLVRAFLGQAETARGAHDAARLLFAKARELPSARTGLMRQVLDRLEGDRWLRRYDDIAPA